MSNKSLIRGTRVTVLAFGGEKLQRRVWEDDGNGVLICTEEEYQRAIRQNDEATCSAFPRTDILEVHDTLLSEGV